MKRLTFTLVLFLAAVVSQAQLSLPGASGLIPDSELIKLSGVVTQRSGDDVRGTVTAAIASGWHINSVKPLDDFVIPSELKFDPTTAELLHADFPPHELKDFTFSGGKKLAVYEGTISIPFQARLKSGATASKVTRPNVPSTRSTVFFTNQVGIVADPAAPTKISRGGDSGSLWLQRNPPFAIVALNHASDDPDTTAFACRRRASLPTFRRTSSSRRPARTSRRCRRRRRTRCRTASWPRSSRRMGCRSRCSSSSSAGWP